MRSFFLTFFGILIGSYSMAAGKLVATCGDYKLIQNVSQTYFAGILHQVNTYQIVDPSGESLNATIDANSEGATISATKDLKVDQNTGAVLESQNLKLIAEWSDFYLSVTAPNTPAIKIPCAKK